MWPEPATSGPRKASRTTLGGPAGPSHRSALSNARARRWPSIAAQTEVATQSLHSRASWHGGKGQGRGRRRRLRVSRRRHRRGPGRRQTVGMRHRGIAGVVGRGGLGLSRAGIGGGGRLSSDCQGSELAVRRTRRAELPSTGAIGTRFSLPPAHLFCSRRAGVLPCAGHRIGRSAWERSEIATRISI